MHISLHTIEIGSDERSKVNLVDDTDITTPEHHRVFVHHIVTFSRADKNNPDFCSEQEIGGTYHVSHVFDEKDINAGKREMFGSMFHQVGIKVTLFAGIGVFNGDAQCFDPLVVIISEYIPCNRPTLQAPFGQKRNYPFNEGCLSRSDGPQKINGTNPVRAEKGSILLSNSVIDVEYVLFQSDVDMVHVSHMDAAVFIGSISSHNYNERGDER